MVYPNDLAVDARTSGWYLTDSGHLDPINDGWLYYCLPGNTPLLQCLDEGMLFVNGVALSPDGRCLYVDEGNASAGPNPHMEEWYAKGGLEFLRQVVDGRMDNIGSVRDDVPHILGRPALGLRAWTRQHRDELIALAARSL